MGQAHAAELDRPGDPVPARFRPPPINIGEARRRRHHPVLVARAGKIAGAVERRDFLGGEAPRFADDRRYGVPIEIAGEPLPDHVRQVGDGAQRKQDIADRRTIRHLSLLHAAAAARDSARSLNRAKLGRRSLPRHGQISLCTVVLARNARRTRSIWRCNRKTTRLAAANPDSIAAAAACLRAGGLVAMPTETVYGLAADATSDAAVAAIYAAKERPAINPLIAHVLRPRSGARTCRLQSRSRTTGARLLARTAYPRPARGAGLPGQPARARRSRHRGAARAGA